MGITVGEYGTEENEQVTEMPEDGAQESRADNVVEAHSMSQWKLSYADVVTGRCKRVSWKVDPTVKE